MAIIDISALKKVYNPGQIPVKAIDGIDLSFQEGEFTALVAPSGAGKTTLLNLLGGLDTPTEGSIVINGIRIDTLSASKKTSFRLKNIGFVFQAYNLIPVLTAIENIEFIMELQGIPKERRRQRSIELLEAVGIPDKAHVRPQQLSGGQQQRVAVARALASKPKFVLADEPTANLDSKSTENLLDIMLQLNKKENITFIFASHDSRVITRARRIITLEDGKVIRDEQGNVTNNK
jgi:putative ABC transport system ATP-binding protein